MRRMIQLVLAFLLTCIAAVPCMAQNNWPQFRGADAMGFMPGVKLADHWSTTENVAWKTDLPGRGWSSPIVWGDKIFVTSCVNSGQTEEIKKGLYFGGEPPQAFGGSARLESDLPRSEHRQHRVGANGARRRAKDAHSPEE